MRTAAAEARIGVAILSEHYLRKKWPMSELSDFLSYQTCLPVLLGLSYQELQQIVREQSLLSQADQADLLRITMVTEDGGNQQHFLQRIAFEVVRILVTRECNRDRLGNTAADMDFLDNVITAATKVALLPELSGRRHDAATAWTGQLDETRKTLRQAIGKMWALTPRQVLDLKV
ncbi:hypothetical protein WJX72_010470 [[Myrmecia] bisecta]|uniref:TIR domain-containing protein n=1 Tax=[Myrmecia] bisecta TaxID=41462 RepID=A0AAW1Q694_9CHLO